MMIKVLLVLLSAASAMLAAYNYGVMEGEKSKDRFDPPSLK